MNLVSILFVVALIAFGVWFYLENGSTTSVAPEEVSGIDEELFRASLKSQAQAIRTQAILCADQGGISYDGPGSPLCPGSASSPRWPRDTTIGRVPWTVAIAPATPPAFTFQLESELGSVTCTQNGCGDFVPWLKRL